MVFLLPRSLHGCESAVGQCGQLSRYSASATAGQVDHFASVKASLRLAEKDREHPLFGARKESIGQIPSGGGRHRYTHIGGFPTHFGIVFLSGINSVAPGAEIEAARIAA